MNTDSETRTLRPQTPVIPSETHPFTILNFLIVERMKHEKTEFVKQQALFNLALYAADPENVLAKTKQKNEEVTTSTASKPSTEIQSTAENVKPDRKMKVGAVKTKSTPKAPKLSAETQSNLENLRLLANGLKQNLFHEQAGKTPMPVVAPVINSEEQFNKVLERNGTAMSRVRPSLIRQQSNQFFEEKPTESGISKLPKAQHNRPSPVTGSINSLGKHLATISILAPKVTEFLNKFPSSNKPELLKKSF